MPLLPPTVVGPLSQCSPGVRVQGQLTGATVTIYSNGFQVGSGTANWSDQVFDLAANVTLVPGAQVTARQTVGTEISPESPLPVVVQAKPPTLGYVGIKTHLYICGLCALLDGVVPGATIEVTVNGVTRGTGVAYDGSAQIGFTQATAAGEILEARQIACGTPGPVTTLPTPDSPPAHERRLAPPTVEAPLRQCQRTITVSNVLDGARVTLLQSGRPQEAGNFVVDSEYFRVSPLALQESVTAAQAFPNCKLTSQPSSPAVVAGPAQPVTPPTVGPDLCAGGVIVTLSGLFIGSPVKIYQNGAEIGEGEAPAESYTFQVPPLQGGAAITATQELCTFWSPPSNPVIVNPQPASLPTPVIPGPLYQCASVVRVTNLHPGSTVFVWSTMLHAPIGSQQVHATEADIPVSPQLIGPAGGHPGDRIFAQEIGCGLTVESQRVQVKAMPRLGLPTVQPTVDACMRSVTVANVVPGANVDVHVNGAWRGSAAAGAATVEVPIIYGPLHVGDNISARQRLCDSITEFGKPTPVVSPVGLNYTTRHFDVARTGWNPYEKILTVGNASTVRELFSHAIDGQAYAQPLYVHHVFMPGQGAHNTIFVATENDSVYAFDADTPQPALWQTSLIPPGEAVVSIADVGGCNNVAPVIGITSTPVIDCSAYTMYVVAKTKTVSGAGTTFHYRLHALDISTGAERPGSPVEIPDTISYPGTGAPNDGHGHVLFSSEWHLNRPALLLLNGTLYIAFGSHCDFHLGSYHGWVLAYNPSSLAHIATFNATPGNFPNQEAGGIWQSGGGLAGDSEGFIYCTTGNGQFDANTGGSDYGDTVLRLDAGLAVNSYFTPGNQQDLENNDWDLGSGAVLVLPDDAPGCGTHPHMLVTCGKDGNIFLLDRHNMGGYTGPKPAGDNPQAIQTLPLQPGVPIGNLPGPWGGPAYYGVGQNQSLVYYAGNGGKLTAFELQGGQLAPAMAGGNPSQSATTFGGGSFPVVSSNQQVAGTAVVWAIERTNPVRLHAYNAADLTHHLVDLPAGAWNNPNGGAFLEPTVINGKVYVGSDGALTVFGI